MELLLTACVGNADHRLGWISLQPDGSVSVGLSDRAFVSPDFKAKNFLWNAYNRETLHYVVSSDPHALKSVLNPHLTYHPPHWFHLKAAEGHALFEGIADLKIMLEQGGSVPWIRCVSKQVAKLSTAGLPRKPGQTTIFRISLPHNQCSVGIGVDFVRTGSGPEIPGALLDEFVPWQSYFLRIHAVALAPQIATLSWFHQR